MKKLFILNILLGFLFLGSGSAFAQTTAKQETKTEAKKSCCKKETECAKATKSETDAKVEASAALEKCPLKGTADCPLVKDCPKKGTADCPYKSTSAETGTTTNTAARSCCKGH